MIKIIRWIKRNVALSAALLLAVVTSFIVTPDKEYVTYFDFKTLTCLFCVLAVVCALKNVNFFYILAKKIVKKFGTARKCVIALVYITFIGSMLIANDMALLTFLPLGYFVLDTTDKKQYMAFTFIMQNIAANLGGMLTPSVIRRTFISILNSISRLLNSCTLCCFRLCCRLRLSRCAVLCLSETKSCRFLKTVKNSM